MKKCLTFIALACIGMMTATASAQDTLQGDFFAATLDNTVTSGGEGIAGLSPLDAGWRVGADAGILGTGFNSNLIGQELVTTIDGFNPGDVYDVAFVYTNPSFFSNDNLSAGFESGSLTNVPANHADVVDGTLGSFGSNLNGYDLNLGPQTVNDDGELQLFANDSSASNFASTNLAYKGFTAQFVSSAATASVPEPSSLALLGLAGGLGMLRRRR